MSAASQVSRGTLESRAVCGIFSKQGAPGEPTDMLGLQEAQGGDSLRVLVRNSRSQNRPKNPSKKHIFGCH